jgi:hypothetical protein
VWHRLTWNNDTNVVSRIIDAEHASAVEDLGDGEAFLMTDWSESVRRVQFHRKRTFDAGATPGLDDFERPELKSISDDLVSDLREISDEQERRESELADLRQEVERKERRIRELEEELAEARDLSRMADRFAQAMLQKVEAPYRGGEGRNLARAGTVAEDQAELHEYEPDGASEGESGEATANDDADDHPDIEPNEWPTLGAVASSGGGEGDEDATPDASNEQAEVTFGDATDEDPASSAESTAGANGESSRPAGPEPGTREAVVARLRSEIDELPDLSRRMLAHYRTAGPADPIDAHVAAGGTPEGPMAYGRNRPLRTAGFVEHVEEDRYRYALPDRVAEAFDGHLDGDALDEAVRDVERAFVDGETLAAEATDVRVADERDEVEVVDDGVVGDDGFVDEDAVLVEESGGAPASADDATRQQMASGSESGSGSGSDDPTERTDAEIL